MNLARGSELFDQVYIPGAGAALLFDAIRSLLTLSARIHGRTQYSRWQGERSTGTSVAWEPSWPSKSKKELHRKVHVATLLLLSSEPTAVERTSCRQKAVISQTHQVLISQKIFDFFWVAVQELKLSYHSSGTLLFAIYP